MFNWRGVLRIDGDGRMEYFYELFCGIIIILRFEVELELGIREGFDWFGFVGLIVVGERYLLRV